MTDPPRNEGLADGASDDEVAARRGLAARDRDIASGTNRRPHEFSRDVGVRAQSAEPAQSSEERIDAASSRDADARARDVIALARDHASDGRSRVMNDRDAACEHDGARPITGAEVLVRAGAQRVRAAHERTRGAEYRTLADEDHRAAASDRELAARDRLLALADREAFVRLLAIMETDPLTGARTRLAGLTDLEHEIDRCRRTSGLLVVSYIDVIGLKAANDSRGHLAGDELLTRVVATIVEHLRSYDLVVRLGGDEFLCAMSNMTLADASQRLENISSSLAVAPEPAAIRWGLARLKADETAVQLIARADQHMIHTNR